MKRTIFPLLSLLVLGLTTGASADELIFRAYDVSDLVRKVRDFPAPKLGLQGLEEDASFDPFDADEEDDAHMTMEDLVELIKENVAPGTWDGGGNSISHVGNTLIIACRADDQKKVAASLPGVPVAVPRLYRIDARFVALPRGAAAKLGFAKGSRSRLAVVDEEKTRKALETLMADVEVTTITAPRVTLFEKQRGNVTVMSQRAYVADMEVDEKTGTADPVIEVLNEGILLEVVARKYRFGEGVFLEWQATVAHADELRNTAGAGNAKIELPHVQKSISEGRAVIRDDELLLLRGLDLAREDDREGLLIIDVEKVPLKTL